MANRYFRNTGNTDWRTATNWSTTDGGPADTAVPASTDDVFFSNLSGDCYVVMPQVYINSLTFTAGYTGAFTINTYINFNTSIEFSAAAHYYLVEDIANGTGIWAMTSGTIKSNGAILPWSFGTDGGTGITITLLDNLYITDFWCAWGGTFIINGYKIYISRYYGNNATISGTTVLEFTGNLNSKWYGGATCSLAIIINKSGGILTLDGNFGGYIGTKGTVTYTAGTVDFSDYPFTAGTGAILNTAGMSFNTLSVIGTTVTLLNNVTSTNLILSSIVFTLAGAYTRNCSSLDILNGSQNLTITGNIICSGLFTRGGTSAGTNTINSTVGTIRCGGLYCRGTTQVLKGTMPIYVTGGTISSQTATVYLQMPLYLDGNVTFTGFIKYGLSTLNYVSGIIDTTNLTLSLTGATTLNTNGMIFNTVLFTSGGTYTLSSKLTARKIQTVGNITITLAGQGIETEILFVSYWIIFTSLTQYIVTKALVGDYGSMRKSTIASSPARLVFTGYIQLINASIITDIDSSGGNEIHNLYGGTLTRTTNRVNNTSQDSIPAEGGGEASHVFIG